MPHAAIWMSTPFVDGPPMKKLWALVPVRDMTERLVTVVDIGSPIFLGRMTIRNVARPEKSSTHAVRASVIKNTFARWKMNAFGEIAGVARQLHVPLLRLVNTACLHATKENQG